MALIASLAVSASAQLTTEVIVGDVPDVVAFLPDPNSGPNTFYVVQRTGKVLVLQDGAILPTPFLDLTGQVALGPEQGLLGMVFHPDLSRIWVFVNFTNTDGDTVIARFRRVGSDLRRADPATRLDLLWSTGERVIRQPAPNHNGGHLAFGNDGMLYIGLGDGGGSNDQFNHAQNPNSLLGKMLRINVTVASADTKGYAVPDDNPFVGLPALPEIWAFGLRNPWRFSFDNHFPGRGALLIADVGELTREEVSYEPAGRGGRNYGWPNREGAIATPGATPPPPAFQPLTNPLFDYPRDVGHAIIGGYVYRGSALPAMYRGRYFVADSISGVVASVGLNLDPQTGDATFADAIDHTAELGGAGIVSFAEIGELYIIRSSGSAAVSKIIPTPAAFPQAPQNVTAQVSGSSVQLSWTPPAGPAADQYYLYVGWTLGAYDVLFSAIPGNLTSISAVGVPNGRYFVSMRAVSNVGQSPPSPDVEVVVGCGPPPPPAEISYTKMGRTATVSWTPVPGAEGYVMEWTDFPPPSVWRAVSFGPETTSVTGTNLPDDLYLRLHARTTCGGWSAPKLLAFTLWPF